MYLEVYQFKRHTLVPQDVIAFYWQPKFPFSRFTEKVSFSLYSERQLEQVPALREEGLLGGYIFTEYPHNGGGREPLPLFVKAFSILNN